MEPDFVRLIADNLDDVLWMATADRSRMIYISPSYERVYGRTVASLVARPASLFDAVHPDDRARIAERSRTAPSWQHEYRIIRPDGTVRWVWGRGQLVHHADGDYVMGVVTDITERALAEQERQSAVKRLELITRSTSDGLWDWNVATGNAWWSESFYENFGLDRSVVPSFERWVAAIHPEDRARVVGTFEQTIARQQPSWAEAYRMVRSDGTVRETFDRAFIHYEGGKPVRMGGVQMDITERRELEAQLRHAQRMDAMGQLAGGIAHDFNNMLQAMMIDLQLIKVGELAPRTTELVGHALDAVERAASLTKQLLVFTRREIMAPRRIALDPAISSIARMLERLLGEQVALDLQLGAPDLLISVDGGMLDQVVMNLAINARDAMPDGGTLTVTTGMCTAAARPGRWACISILDTGAGISPDVLPRIFEPFFSTKERGHGTGLGLAVVYSIVEQHRGWIEVDSEPGTGTAFRAYFPAGELAAATDAEPTTKPSARGTETILVVEDDTEVRRAICHLLEDEGYRVWEADQATAALEIWDREAGKIDLVLTDLVMPGGIDGTQLAAQLELRKPGLKLVFATGYRRDIELAVHQTLLHKPVSASVLLDAVRTSLDR